MNKKCPRCGDTKPLEDFNKHSKMKDGRQGYCRVCARIKIKEHYKANKKKSNAYRKEWRKANKERDRASSDRWRDRHPEAYKAAYKRHNRARREKVLLKISDELKCVRCGCDKFELLEINHKDGGGLKEVGRYPQRFMSRILSGERKTDDLEILCKVCNILHYVELKHGPQPYILRWEPQNE